MSLRKRLFLWIGALFLLLTLVSYFFPRLIVRQEVQGLQRAFGSQIEKDRLAAYRERSQNFQEKVENILDAIHTTLLYVQNVPLLQQSFDSKDHPQKAVWTALMQQLLYAPHLQAVQLSAPVKSDKDFVIAINNPRLYPTDSFALSDHLALVRFIPSEAQNSPLMGPYLGIRLKDDSSPTAFIYFLYPVEDFFELSDSEVIKLFETNQWAQFQVLLHSQIESIEHELTDNKIDSLNALVAWKSRRQVEKKQPIDKKALFHSRRPLAKYALEKPPRDLRNIFFNSVKLYTQLVLTSMPDTPFDPAVPLGMTSLFDRIAGVGRDVDNQQKWFQGFALLNEELFFNRAVLEPTSSDKKLVVNPLLNDFLLIDSGMLDAIEPYQLTIGSSLLPLLTEIAIGSELVVFVDPKGHVHSVIDAEGSVQNPFLFEGIDFTQILDSGYGQMFIQNQPYYFLQLNTPLVPQLHLFIFKADATEAIYTLKQVVSERLKSSYYAFSYQLLIVSIFVLVLAMVILAILSNRITKPIVLLAQATEKIAQGDYNGAELPSLSDRLDEIAMLYDNFSHMLVGLRDKERLRNVLDRMVSREIATEILKGKLQLGGENKIVTVLFADIRQFTHLTENLEPQNLIMQLNDYMTRMSRLIEGQGGVIDKYVGDEIMGLYGTPIEMQDSAKRAIISALLMMRALELWNVERKQEGLFPFQIGIGINTGKVVAGNMGSETRLSYTVLGANVNLASRLCGAAGPGQIFITEATLEASGLKDQLEVETLAEMHYKGFSHPIATYLIKGWKA